MILSHNRILAALLISVLTVPPPEWITTVLFFTMKQVTSVIQGASGTYHHTYTWRTAPLSFLSLHTVPFPQGPSKEPAQLQLLKFGTELRSLPLRYMWQEHGKVNREAGGNGAYSLSGLSSLPSLPPTWVSDPSPRSSSRPVGLGPWGKGWSPKTIRKHRHPHYDS